jgi:hypothetical protein
MKTLGVRARVLGGIVAIATTTACGGGGDGGSDGPRAGERATVSAPWSNYCVATLTEDTAITDFGDPVFTARAGDQYLLTSWDDDFGEEQALFAYMTESGPYELELGADAGSGLAFTSNCSINQGVSYYAVFEDVSVYAAADLAVKICDLRAGTALPQTATLAGYSTDEFNLTGPTTYEVYLNAFSASCGGAASGYISVPQVQVFRTHTWLVPIISILGPT